MTRTSVSLEDQVLRVYCPTHRIHFQTLRAATIPCEAEGHTLALNFPHEGLWEYCCDCQNFLPSELVGGGKGKERCQNCERHTARLFLCDVCAVLSLDSDERGRGKVFRVDDGPEPACPGCLTRPAVAPKPHRCADAAVEFLTAREVCPFCHENIAEPPPTERASEVQSARGAARPKVHAAPLKGGTESRVGGVRRADSADAVHERAASPATVQPVSLPSNGRGGRIDEHVASVTTDSAPVAASRRVRKVKALAAVAALTAVVVAFVLAARWLRAGDTPPAQESQTPARMAYVPGGEFTMGRGAGDEYEAPPHTVSVRPFYIDLYEVTCEEYARFVKAENHAAPQNWPDGRYPPGAAQHPVTGVTWDDARRYAEWAGKRLPTEEEWEFAARGTDGRLYPWGNEWKVGMANAGGGLGGGGGLADVGVFKGASPFGAYDMVGNAWEWTADDLRPYPKGRLPEQEVDGLKVIRGGFWGSRTVKATTTFRRGWPARGAHEYVNTGFRCAMSLPERPQAER